jgi:hypothetical protein
VEAEESLNTVAGEEQLQLLAEIVVAVITNGVDEGGAMLEFPESFRNHVLFVERGGIGLNHAIDALSSEHLFDPAPPQGVMPKVLLVVQKVGDTASGFTSKR